MSFLSNLSSRMVRALVVPVLAFSGVCLAGIASANAAEPMTFSLVSFGNAANCGNRCVKAVKATGEIVGNTPEKLLEFIRQQNPRDKSLRSVVFINSPGGLVVSSMRLGVIFRAMGAAVVVNGQCASACVYALMGAKKRIAPPESRVILHRMFAFERFGGSDDNPGGMQKTFGNRELQARLSRYARSMGVSTDVIRAAEAIQRRFPLNS